MAKLSVASIKKKVAKRAKDLCEYCLLPESYSASTFELEHINPISMTKMKRLMTTMICCREKCVDLKQYKFYE